MWNPKLTLALVVRIICIEMILETLETLKLKLWAKIPKPQRAYITLQVQ
jgi:hypothetical protein